MPLKAHCLIVLFLCVGCLGMAQEYKHEIGGAVGISSYMGDANKHKLYSNLGGASGFLYRRNLSLHTALRFSPTWAHVRGNTLTEPSAFPGLEQRAFSRHLIDASLQAELNLFPYSDAYQYLSTKSWTPYFAVGIGAAVGLGKSFWLRPHIPFGLGIKYKIKNRVNVGAELAFRKMLADDLDVTSPTDGWTLDAPYGIESSILKNQDWFTLTTIFVSWDFGLKNEKCCD